MLTSVAILIELSFITPLLQCFEVFTEHNFDAFRGSIFTAVVWPQVLSISIAKGCALVLAVASLVCRY